MPEGLPRLRVLLATAAGTVLVELRAAGARRRRGRRSPRATGCRSTERSPLRSPLWLAAHQIPLVLGRAAAERAPAAAHRGAVRRRRARRRSGRCGDSADGCGTTAARSWPGSPPRTPPSPCSAARCCPAGGGGGRSRGRRWSAPGLLAGAAAVTGMVAGLRGSRRVAHERAGMGAGRVARRAAVAAGRSRRGRIGAAGGGAARGGRIARRGGLPRARADVRRRPGRHPARRWPTCPTPVSARCSWALGVGFSVGAATASPFDAIAGRPSSFPLFAALPTGPRLRGRPRCWCCRCWSGCSSGWSSAGRCRSPRTGPGPVVAGLGRGVGRRRCSPCWPGAGWRSGRTTRCTCPPGWSSPRRCCGSVSRRPVSRCCGGRRTGVRTRSTHGGVAVADEPAEPESAAARDEETRPRRRPRRRPTGGRRGAGPAMRTSPSTSARTTGTEADAERSARAGSRACEAATRSPRRASTDRRRGSVAERRTDRRGRRRAGRRPRRERAASREAREDDGRPLVGQRGADEPSRASRSHAATASAPPTG